MKGLENAAVLGLLPVPPMPHTGMISRDELDEACAREAAYRNKPAPPPRNLQRSSAGTTARSPLGWNHCWICWRR
jgi:hypothetical protein